MGKQAFISRPAIARRSVVRIGLAAIIALFAAGIGAARAAPLPAFTNAPLRVSGISGSYWAPAAASGRDGLAWIVYSGTFTDGDRIFANYSDGVSVSGAMPVSMLAGVECGPAVCAAAEHGAWVTWAALRVQEWRILLRRLTRNEVLAGEIHVARGAEMLARPAIAAEMNGDGVWVAWEQWEEGATRIFARRVTSGRLEPEILVSGAYKECYRPSVAVDADGRAWVAWDFYTGARKYMIAARAIENGVLSDEIRIGDKDIFLNADVKLLADPRGGVWALYSGSDGGRLVSIGASEDERQEKEKERTDEVAAEVREKQAWRRKNALFIPAAGSATDGYGYTKMAADASGALWFANMTLNVWRLDNDGWSAPVNARPAGPWNNQAARTVLAFAGTTAAVVWEEMSGKISMRSADMPAIEGLAAPRRKRPERVRDEPDQDQQQPAPQPQPAAPPGEKNPVVRIEDKDFRIYWGDLHTHASASEFWGFLDWRCNRARDIAGLDFLAFTDHDNCTPDLLNPSEWVEINAYARRFNRPNAFTVFPGWEWSASGLSGRYGHKIVVCRDEAQPQINSFSRAANRPDRLYSALPAERYLIQAAHHASLPWAPADWEFNTPQAAPFVEISSSRGVFEFFGNHGAAPGEIPGHSVRDALARGHRLGLMSSSDCHLPASYEPNDFVAAIATNNTREALWEAFHARRVYACRGARFVVDLRVDGRIMGSEFFAPAPGPHKIEAVVRSLDNAPVGRVELVRNNKVVQTIEVKNPALSAEWVDAGNSGADSTYYYLRVIRESGKVMAWSSPVWATAADIVPRQGRLFVPPGESRPLELEILGPETGVEGTLHILTPRDWRVEPENVQFRALEKAPFSAKLTVIAPERKAKEKAELAFEATLGSQRLKALRRTTLYLAPWPERGFATPPAPAAAAPENAGANYIRAIAARGEKLNSLHFIRNWLVLGPFHYDPQLFPSLDCREAVNTVPSGIIESELIPAPGAEAGDRRWTAYTPFNIGAAHYGVPEHIALDSSGMSWDIVEYAIAYLVADVYSPKELGGCSLLLGSDDYVKAWLNGRLVFTWNEERRGADPDTNVCPGLTLQQGWNRLLIKLVNVNSGWSMFARFATASGLAMEIEDDPPPGSRVAPRP